MSAEVTYLDPEDCRECGGEGRNHPSSAPAAEHCDPCDGTGLRTCDGCDDRLTRREVVVMDGEVFCLECGTCDDGIGIRCAGCGESVTGRQACTVYAQRRAVLCARCVPVRLVGAQ